MRYKIWNKTEPIYTPVGEILTAEQWLKRYPWGNIPSAKMVVGGGTINGSFCGELNDMKEMYWKMGAAITDDMTDEEVLSAIENFEDNPPGSDIPSVEERTAAAMEAQVLLAMPKEETETAVPMMMAMAYSTEETSIESPSFKRIRRNYQRGLWNASLVNMAASKKEITRAEAEKIISGE